MKISDELFNLALKTRENSYSPYSQFKVGVALYADNGKFYASCNVENVSYPCGACAETGAISAMIADGAKKILQLLVISEGETLISPCGACRQRIKEFSDASAVIYLANLSGIQKETTIKDLLPMAFDEGLKNDK